MLLENAARGPRAAFSRPWSQFFTIRTDPELATNIFILQIDLQVGLFTLVKLAYVPSTHHRKKSNERSKRVTQILDKERCIKEQVYFELISFI